MATAAAPEARAGGAGRGAARSLLLLAVGALRWVFSWTAKLYPQTYAQVWSEWGASCWCPGDGARCGSKLRLQQYGLLRIDGLHLTVRDPGGVVAPYMGFPSRLLWHPAFCLSSHMLSYPWLLPIFCLFHLAHSSFPALPPYLQTRTGTNFLQFGWSWKQNNLLLNTHLFWWARW